MWFASRGPGDLVNKSHPDLLHAPGTADSLFTLDEAITNTGSCAPTTCRPRCSGSAGRPRRLPDHPGRGTSSSARPSMAQPLPQGRQRVDTGPALRVDRPGRRQAQRRRLPAGSKTPLVGTGSGTSRWSTAAARARWSRRPGTGEIGSLGAAVADSRATNAVNVSIPRRPSPKAVIGAPKVTLTYSGTAGPPTPACLGKIVDEDSGVVAGPDHPIPLVLDGLPHTVTRSLEDIALTRHPGAPATRCSSREQHGLRAGANAGRGDVLGHRVELPTANP